MEDGTPADPIAELDQALAGMRHMALILRTYYDELRNQAFTENDAMQLTLNYQGHLAAQAIASNLAGQ